MEADVIAGLSILVVEDMLSLGTALAHGLKQAGAQVIGPIATVGEALAALDLLPDRLPDIATLDVQLDRETSFPIADELTRLGIPFVFATGTAGIIPVAHRARIVCAKPYTLGMILTALRAALAGNAATQRPNAGLLLGRPAARSATRSIAHRSCSSA